FPAEQAPDRHATVLEEEFARVLRVEAELLELASAGGSAARPGEPGGQGGGVRGPLGRLPASRGTPSPQFSSGLPLDCVLNTREAARCRAPFLLTRVGRVSGKRIRPGRATAPPHHRAQVGHRGIPMSIARRRLLPVLAALAVLFL